VPEPRSLDRRPAAERLHAEKAYEGTNVLRPELQAQLTPFLQSVAQAPQAALLLDYDGTLAPFQQKRDEAFPYPGVLPLLQKIMITGRTRLVIISGRDATDVLPFLRLHPRPEIWGIHGLQRLRTNGTLEMPLLDQRTSSGLSDAERWLNYQNLRHAAEFKAGGIAVHWRGLDEIAVEDLCSRVLLGWRLIAEHSHLDILPFDGGVEIRASHRDKGDALRTLLSEMDPDIPVAYLGDDFTDESAFLAIEGRGIGVLVRPRWRQTEAHFWLKPPGELLEFLNLWLHCSTTASTPHLQPLSQQRC